VTPLRARCESKDSTLETVKWRGKVTPTDFRESGLTRRDWHGQTDQPSALDVKQSRRFRGCGSFAIRLAAGMSVLGFIFLHYDQWPTLQLLLRVRPVLFAASVGLFAAVQLVSAFRWQLLARLNGIRGRYRDYVAYYFIGMFTNVFVPGLIGGDALRAFYLGRRHNRIAEAAGSVVADRGVGLLALFWLSAGASLCVRGVQLPESVLRVTVGVGAVSVLAYFAGPVISVRFTRIRGLSRVLTPVIPYLSNPMSLVPAIVLSAFLQCSFAVCQYLLALGLALEIPLTTFLLIVPIANVIASVPISINGLGLREASYLVLLGMAGVAKEQAVALSILYFAATLAAGLTGIIPFMFTSINEGQPTSSEYELIGGNEAYISGSSAKTAS
jgi:uncharacterized protein (TIRG00374 family)